MNDLELRNAHDAIQQEINYAVLDQRKHTELSYLLPGLTADKVRALLAHIRELRSIRQQVTQDLLERAIGEEETEY